MSCEIRGSPEILFAREVARQSYHQASFFLIMFVLALT
uniref:Uncharacterized protein n=1 Tax=Arundo donax TaxID=35708 RepID=A0A0A9G548_ARUDO